MYFRQPRPQIVRSKSVGAVTRRTQGQPDSRQHKIKPYSISSGFRQRRNSSGTLISSPGTNLRDIYRHQGTFDDAFQNNTPTQSDSKTVNNMSKDLETQLSFEKRPAKGGSLSEEIPDYPSNIYLSLPANIPRNSLSWTNGLLTNTSFPILAGTDGQAPGELSPVCSQLANNNANNVNLSETIHKLHADSSSAGLMRMANMNPELFSAEKPVKPPLCLVGDASITMTHQYGYRPGARTARRPLASLNLEDNQFNVQGTDHLGNATESRGVRQSEACPQKNSVRAQMSRSGVNKAEDCNNDENVGNETELRCFAPTDEDIYDYDADQDVYSSRLEDRCLDSALQKANQKKIVPTDARNVLRCHVETCAQSPSSLRRQDTLLLNQDVNINDDSDGGDDGDGDNNFDSFGELLKSFLCQEIPNDSYMLQNNEDYDDVDTLEQESDEARVSYKNLLNCPPRYQCLVCDSNLEIVPVQLQDMEVSSLQLQDLACEHECFPFFRRADITTNTDLYCPQCCCLRSIYCPE